MSPLFSMSKEVEWLMLNSKIIWDFFKSKGLNDYACAGILGNADAESGLKPNNLQDTYQKKLSMTDEEYTKSVDDGIYDNFVYDAAGYGLFQFTYWTLKKGLLEYARKTNRSIGNLDMQLEYSWSTFEKSYSSMLSTLKTARSVLEASNAVLLKFECPADQSVSMQNKRAAYGQKYYDKYATNVANGSLNTGGTKMNENELRKKLVSTAINYLGYKESDGTHKEVIDIYNNCTPVPSGYKVKYTDAWCATYVSAMGIEAGLKDIVLRECSCNRMINLYKKANRWVEDDAYTPQAGDIIFYDWQDDGVGDNAGSSDHVGIVVSVNGTTMKIIEGNYSNSVGYRTIKVNGKYIRGYGIPDYAGKKNAVISNVTTSPSVTTPTSPSTSGTSNSTELKYNIGDIVKFIGNAHYASSNSNNPKTCKSGTAKVTGRSKGAKHPYHLVAEKGKGSSVYGWVNEEDIASKVSVASGNNTGINNKVDSKAKVDSAQSYSKNIAGTYKTTAALNLRAGAGTSKTILTTIPKGGNVTCYGYYTNISGVRWYYVTYKNNSGVRFTGFVSSKYLK